MSLEFSVGQIICFNHSFKCKVEQLVRKSDGPWHTFVIIPSV